MTETYTVGKIKIIKLSIEKNYLDDFNIVVHIKQNNAIHEINLDNYGWLKNYILENGNINKNVIGDELFAVYTDEKIELFSSNKDDSRITTLINYQNGSEQSNMTPC